MPNASPQAQAQVALQAFFGITREWVCSDHEQMQLLGGISQETLRDYADRPQVQLPADVMERISLIMGIYKALRTIYSTEELANQRVRRTTTDRPFDGLSAMAFMICGDLDALWETRRYFDAQCN